MDELAPDRPIPDFVLPGFMKGGTTAINRWVVAAGLKAPAAEKEPDFFSDDSRFRKGRSWYEERCGDPARGLVGDASTSYLDPDVVTTVVDRLAAANPDVRIIISVRDPLDRAISHVRHDTRLGSRRGVSPEEVAAAIVEGSSYVRRSLYATAVRPYLETFSTDQILVLSSSSGDDDRWAAIAEHLGRPGLAMPVEDSRTYRTEDMRSYSTLLGRWTGSRLRAAIGPMLPAALKRRAVESLARGELPPTPVEATRRLVDPGVRELLTSELAEFEELTARCRRV